MKYHYFISLLICLLCLSGCRIESVKQHEVATQNEMQTVEKPSIIKKSEIASSKQEEKNDSNTNAKEKLQQDATTSDKTLKEQTPSKGLDQASQKQERETTKPNTKDTPQSHPSSTLPTQEPEPPAVREPEQAYVTISIDMITLLDRMSSLQENKRAYVPSNGWVLQPIQVEIQEGDTVFTVLQRITSRNRIPMEYQGSSANAYQTVYIQGIAHIYEYDCGNLSGWMYFVNGAFVNAGASAYKVKAGDNITWRYTCESGKDL